MVKMLIWLLGAALVFALLVIVMVITSSFDWKLWFVIRRARRKVIQIARPTCPRVRVFSRQAARLDRRAQHHIRPEACWRSAGRRNVASELHRLW